MRIDKWLWAARFFKTRALASRACDLNRVELNGQRAKPAHPVHVGDMVKVANDSGEFHVELLQLSEMRGPASVAAALYRETEESREQRRKVAEEMRASRQFAARTDGRPSKRDRRRIIQFRSQS
jgi:ribosome-associated heat shock protein Hsp15